MLGSASVYCTHHLYFSVGFPGHPLYLVHAGMRYSTHTKTLLVVIVDPSFHFSLQIGALCWAALACIVRPTSAVMWIVLGIHYLWHTRVRLAFCCAVAKIGYGRVLSFDVLVDRIPFIYISRL